MSTPLPEDARDLRLARQVGEQRAAGRRLEEFSADDQLWEVLLAYRQAATPERVAADATKRVWADVERATRRAEDRPPRRRVRIHRLPTWSTWAAGLAAALLVVAGAVWLLTRGPEAVLVAETERAVAEYVTGNGSVVTLRPYSQLYRFEPGHYRLEGEAFFVVVEQPAGRSFSVVVGDATVTVLGTRFNAATWGARTTVYLDEGRVQLASRRTDASVVMAPGQQGVVTEDGVELIDVSEEQALDWLKDELVFETQSVRDVLDEVEQHFGVRVEVPAALAHERITGRILLDDRERALRDLGTVLGGRFVEEDGTYRFEQ